MNDEEHKIQCACVKWFAYQHPELAGLLFAVPNGGARSKATAGKLKAEGVVAGVSDLILLVPVVHHTPNEMIVRHGLCLEAKRKGGYQSPEQKAWQAKVESWCYEYAIFRSLDDFINIINAYLNK